MISIVITSFKEPKTIGKAIESIINQEIKEKYEIIVATPDKETQEIVKKYKKVKLFKDPGKGKTYALNLLLQKLKGELIVLTDGDVYTSPDSINKILKPFDDKFMGCITGRPVSINDRKTMLGFWSHILCYAAHKMRLSRYKSEKFLQCSGYLWAFRNKIIKNIPRETAEDTIVPALFYLKGYKIAYVPEAKVCVKFPSTLADFVDQKKRTAKAHETFSRYIDTKKIPRMKSLKNEILESYKILRYPKTFLEFFWLMLLFPIRLYIWFLVFYKRYIIKDIKVDAWKPTKTTK